MSSDISKLDIRVRRKVRRAGFINDPARFRTRMIENKKRKNELKPGRKDRDAWFE